MIFYAISTAGNTATRMAAVSIYNSAAVDSHSHTYSIDKSIKSTVVLRLDIEKQDLRVSVTGGAFCQDDLGNDNIASFTRSHGVSAFRLGKSGLEEGRSALQ